MRVTIGTFVLADHDKTSVSNFRINGSRLVQVAELVRAETVQVFGRGNRKTTVTFDVSREHADVRTSETFILGHATNVPESGLITFEAISASGALTRRYLNAAVCSVVDCSYAGVTTVHTYQIIGGKMLLQKPI